MAESAPREYKPFVLFDKRSTATTETQATEKQPETANGAVEYRPVVMFDKGSDQDDEDLYDFRPRVEAVSEAEVDAAPKDSSAQESADSSPSETKTDGESSESQEETAPVEKDNGQPKESEPSTPTSSSKTSSGKSEQPAAK